MKGVLIWMLFGFGLVACDRGGRGSAGEEALEGVEKALAEMNERQLEKLKEEGGVAFDPAGLDSSIEAARKMEGVTSGDDAKLAKIMRVFLTKIQEDSAEIGRFQEGLEEGGDYSKVTAAEDFDELSEKVRRYREANRELRRKVDGGWARELGQLVRNEGVGEVSAREFMSGATRSLAEERPYLLAIRDADDAVCEAILAQHEILKSSFGKWTYDLERMTPEIADAEALEAFNAEAEKIGEAMAAQAEAQRRVLERGSADGGS